MCTNTIEANFKHISRRHTGTPMHPDCANINPRPVMHTPDRLHVELGEEAIIGQEYQIDVTIWANLGPSAASDDLDETVDYVDVHRIVKREMDVRSKLVEQVCDRIVKGLRDELVLAERVEVKVTKFQPPIGGDCDHISVVMQG